MRQLSFEARRDLLTRYLDMCLPLYVNSLQYDASVLWKRDGSPLVYAFTTGTNEVDAMVHIDSDYYEQANCGLTMASLVTKVFDSLTHQIERRPLCAGMQDFLEEMSALSLLSQR